MRCRTRRMGSGGGHRGRTVGARRCMVDLDGGGGGVVGFSEGCVVVLVLETVRVVPLTVLQRCLKREWELRRMVMGSAEVLIRYAASVVVRSLRPPLLLAWVPFPLSASPR